MRRSSRPLPPSPASIARFVRAAALGALLLCVLAPLAQAYALVLTNGQRVELVAEPVFKDGWADVQAKDGRRARLPVIIVGWTATNAANGRPPAYRSPGASDPKVWTNADLVALRSARLSLVGQPSMPGEGGGGGGAGPRPAEAEDGRVLAAPPASATEADWRARAQALAERMDANEQQIAYLEHQERAWESVALGLPGIAGGAGFELARVRADLAAARADQSAAQSERVALEEEARRANVPAGWLR